MQPGKGKNERARDDMGTLLFALEGTKNLLPILSRIEEVEPGLIPFLMRVGNSLQIRVEAKKYPYTVSTEAIQRLVPYMEGYIDAMEAYKKY